MTSTMGYEALRRGAGLVDQPDAGVVVVSGADARAFLQNLVSQDVSSVADGEGAHSLLLQPTGKLEVDFRVLVVGDEWWLDCEAGFGERLAATLARFRIRVEVEVEDRSPTWGRLVLRGPGTPAVVADGLGATVPTEPYRHVGWEGARIVRADWPGLPGVDLVGPAEVLARASEATAAAGAVPSTVDDLEVVRVESGVPRQGADLDDRTIPQEALLETSAVDFDKGCFLGQELVCRIRDRGRVTRKLRRLRVGTEEAVPVGATVLSGSDEVGELTSSVVSPEEGSLALGYVRTSVDPGGTVAVRWEGGEAQARVEETAAG